MVATASLMVSGSAAWLADPVADQAPTTSLVEAMGLVLLFCLPVVVPLAVLTRLSSRRDAWRIHALLVGGATAWFMLVGAFAAFWNDECTGTGRCTTSISTRLAVWAAVMVAWALAIAVSAHKRSFLRR